MAADRRRGDRRRILGFACVALLAACASQRSPSSLAAAEATQWSEAPPAQEDAAGAGAEAQVPEEEHADDDGAVDLAIYERLLVEQELRLRSAGVAVAIADDAVGSRDFTSTVEPSTATPGKAASGQKSGAGYGRSAGGGASGVQGGVAGGVPQPAEPPTSAPPRPAPRPSTATSRGDVDRKSKATTSSKSSKKAPAQAPAADRSRDQEADTCLMICELAAATCDLEQRICELASRHPGEARYQQVCARAGEDCRLATAACERCAV